MNSDHTLKNTPANKNRALPKKRPCRTKRQKKFFDEDIDESCKNKNSQQLKGAAGRRGSGGSIGATKKTKTTLVTSEPKIKKISADDEEAWLDALEKGELDDNGCLPKSRDITLLTARQKTKLMTATTSTSTQQRFITGSGNHVVQSSKEEMSEEDRKKREEKNLRRRLQAIKKAEENKRQTIEKLVKVTTGSHHRSGKKSTNLSSIERSTKKPPTPMIRYLSNAQHTLLMYPPGFEHPLVTSHVRSAPHRRLCQICGVNERKYDCSKSKVALCSLKCYKTNLGYLKRRRVHKVNELPKTRL